jgi:TIR domain
MQQIALPRDEAERTAKLRLIFASECCRLLQHHPCGGEGGAKLSPEPPRLFISHAKREAEEQAEELKALVEKTHVDTFFDRVDIAPGYDFTVEIRESIKRSVVLAWQSDDYASRPWCNIEVLTAKESLRPVVVVLGVKSGEERNFPYLGHVRTIVATGGNSTEIIIAAVREYLRKLYAEGRFTSLAEADLIPPAGTDRRRAVGAKNPDIRFG